MSEVLYVIQTFTNIWYIGMLMLLLQKVFFLEYSNIIRFRCQIYYKKLFNFNNIKLVLWTWCLQGQPYRTIFKFNQIKFLSQAQFQISTCHYIKFCVRQGILTGYYNRFFLIFDEQQVYFSSTVSLFYPLYINIFKALLESYYKSKNLF